MTVKRIRFLQELLEFIGLEGRLHLEWISSAEAQKFVQVVADFTEKIRGLGSNPIATFNQKVETLWPQAISGYRKKVATTDQKTRPAEKRKAKSTKN
jgi:hypothetical protein